jgi:tRNA-specific 2-thiouridylase
MTRRRAIATAAPAPIFAAMNAGPLNSLGIAKPPAATRVVVAMSGGVDSSFVAAYLKGEGYDVVGITLRLYSTPAGERRKGACCAGEDIYDARRVAEAIGVPHYVLDYERRFRERVIAPFARSYAAGETPIPCVVCNQRIKFDDLLRLARDLGADALATGHYVRRVVGPDGPEIHRAADATRDQSYFLFATTAGQLAHLRFPLGDMTKDEVRERAGWLGLPVAAKPDSQDICFVPDGDYARVVARLDAGAAEPGDIVDLDGRVLGRHRGVIHFTVGQRRGLGLGGTAEPLYVVRLDAPTRRVVVGARAALAETVVVVGDLNWLGSAIPAEGLDVEVRLRSAQAPAAARVFASESGQGARVALAAPEQAVAPGQACVFYQGSRMLGGGWIRQRSRDEAAA